MERKELLAPQRPQVSLHSPLVCCLHESCVLPGPLETSARHSQAAAYCLHRWRELALQHCSMKRVKGPDSAARGPRRTPTCSSCCRCGAPAAYRCWRWCSTTCSAACPLSSAQVCRAAVAFPCTAHQQQSLPVRHMLRVPDCMHRARAIVVMLLAQHAAALCSGQHALPQAACG